MNQGQAEASLAAAVRLTQERARQERQEAARAARRGQAVSPTRGEPANRGEPRVEPQRERDRPDYGEWYYDYREPTYHPPQARVSLETLSRGLSFHPRGDPANATAVPNGGGD